MPPTEEMVTFFAPPERAEPAEVQRQAQHVSQAQNLGRVLDQVPDLLLVLNRQRQAVFSNQRLLELLDLQCDQPLRGLRPGEIFHCAHSDEMAGGCGTSESCRHCGAVLAILASQQGQRAVRECQLAVVGPDGARESKDLQIWASPFTLDGEPYTFLAISDVSDQKRRRSLERIFFKDILSTASGLVGLTDLIRHSRQDDLPALAESLRQAADYLVQEVMAQRNLLAAESRELKVTPMTFKAGEALQGQMRDLERHPAAEGIVLSFKPPVLEQEITSDPVLLRRVLGSLLKNALEASQPGQTVSAGFRGQDNGVAFWVHNQGHMPREVQLQIFKRSFSTRGHGRGLGAYAARLLTERYLKGRIWFFSGAREGTTFWVWVPKDLPA